MYAKEEKVQQTNDITYATALTERTRLVRLCAHLTGDPDSAEDLAHETLVVALCNEAALRDPARRPQWLSGIARNICRRWAHRRDREINTAVDRPRDGNMPSPEAQATDNVDLEIELEKHELADLLDRALALLPTDTRDVLIHRYINETPHADIAARLGLSEDAVAMRVSRGKLALRRVLTTDLRDQAMSYGIVPVSVDDWRETRIWCAYCGRRRLLGRFTPTTYTLRCPACSSPTQPYVNATEIEVLGGLKSYRPAYNRLMDWVRSQIQPALGTGTMPCTACSQPIQLRRGQRGAVLHDIFFTCPACGIARGVSLAALSLHLPEGRRFWRAHPRIRALPEYEVEAQGRPAVVTGFESVTGRAHIDTMFALDTYELLSVHASSTPE